MDYATIISAALSAGVTLIVCLVNNHFQVSKTTALISYRLSELEKKVDRHNNLVERMFDAERKIDIVSSEVDRHKERLKILEEHVEHIA